MRRLVASHGGGHATLVRAARRARRDPVFEPQPRGACRALGAAEGAVRSARHPQPGADDLMQTNFTLAQLADPHVAESEKILRKCVHCGFCTATCPTYVTLGNELDSPARPHLPDQGHAGERPAGRRRDRHPYRPLPVLPRLHDDLPVRRELHASGRPCARPYREDLPAAAARPADRAPCWPGCCRIPARFRAALTLARLGRPFAGCSGQDAGV